MPSRKIQVCFCAFFCTAVLLGGTLPAAAQSKIYNINVGPSSSPGSAPAAVPQMSPPTQPVALPPRPSLISVSQPPLITNPYAGMPQPVVVNGTMPTYVPQTAPALAAAMAAQDQAIMQNANPVPAAQSAPVLAPALISAPVPVASNAQPETLQPVSNNPLTPPQPSYRPPPPKPPSTPVNLALSPPEMTLATKTGIDFGPQISGYRYHQTGPSASISGARYGGTATGTLALGQGFFIAADGRYSAGWLDYSGSGNLSSRLDTLWEARGLVGTDWIFQYFSMSPYTGFGFRDLTDHDDSVSSTGVHLPLRENELYYVPVGVHPRAPIDDQSRISATLEYDFVVHGEETTHFNDTGDGDPTVRNEIPSGFGFHVDIMYDTPYWSIGPFGSFWSINSSNTSVYHSPGSTCGSTTCSFTAPVNHTIEGGLQFKVHFF